jgi:hypothetical protein
MSKGYSGSVSAIALRCLARFSSRASSLSAQVVRSLIVPSQVVGQADDLGEPGGQVDVHAPDDLVPADPHWAPDSRASRSI